MSSLEPLLAAALAAGIVEGASIFSHYEQMHHDESLQSQLKSYHPPQDESTLFKSSSTSSPSLTSLSSTVPTLLSPVQWGAASILYGSMALPLSIVGASPGSAVIHYFVPPLSNPTPPTMNYTNNTNANTNTNTTAFQNELSNSHNHYNSTRKKNPTLTPGKLPRSHNHSNANLNANLNVNTASHPLPTQHSQSHSSTAEKNDELSLDSPLSNNNDNNNNNSNNRPDWKWSLAAVERFRKDNKRAIQAMKHHAAQRQDNQNNRLPSNNHTNNNPNDPTVPVSNPVSPSDMNISTLSQSSKSKTSSSTSSSTSTKNDIDSNTSYSNTNTSSISSSLPSPPPPNHYHLWKISPHIQHLGHVTVFSNSYVHAPLHPNSIHTQPNSNSIPIPPLATLMRRVRFVCVGTAVLGSLVTYYNHSNYSLDTTTTAINTTTQSAQAQAHASGSPVAFRFIVSKSENDDKEELNHNYNDNHNGSKSFLFQTYPMVLTHKPTFPYQDGRHMPILNACVSLPPVNDSQNAQNTNTSSSSCLYVLCEADLSVPLVSFLESSNSNHNYNWIGNWNPGYNNNNNNNKDSKEQQHWMDQIQVHSRWLHQLAQQQQQKQKQQQQPSLDRNGKEDTLKRMHIYIQSGTSSSTQSSSQLSHTPLSHFSQNQFQESIIVNSLDVVGKALCQIMQDLCLASSQIKSEPTTTTLLSSSSSSSSSSLQSMESISHDNNHNDNNDNHDTIATVTQSIPMLSNDDDSNEQEQKEEEETTRIHADDHDHDERGEENDLDSDDEMNVEKDSSPSQNSNSPFHHLYANPALPSSLFSLFTNIGTSLRQGCQHAFSTTSSYLSPMAMSMAMSMSMMPNLSPKSPSQPQQTKVLYCISGKAIHHWIQPMMVQHGWKVIWYDIQTFHPTQLMHDLQSTPSESLSTNNTNSKKEDTKCVFVCGANDASTLEHTCVLHPFLQGVVNDDNDDNNNDGSGGSSTINSKESTVWTHNIPTVALLEQSSSQKMLHQLLPLPHSKDNKDSQNVQSVCIQSIHNQVFDHIRELLLQYGKNSKEIQDRIHEDASWMKQDKSQS